MKEASKQKRSRTIYIAHDGKEFNSRKARDGYEQELGTSNLYRYTFDRNWNTKNQDKLRVCCVQVPCNDYSKNGISINSLVRMNPYCVYMSDHELTDAEIAPIMIEAIDHYLSFVSSQKEREKARVKRFLAEATSINKSMDEVEKGMQEQKLQYIDKVKSYALKEGESNDLDKSQS